METLVTWAGQAAFLITLGWFAWLALDAKVIRPYKKHQDKRAKAKTARARARARKTSQRRTTVRM